MTCFKRNIRNTTIFILSAILIVSCSISPPPSRGPYIKTSSGKTKPYKIGNKWYYPIPNAKNFTQEGKASWYGKKFHGRKTANGEIYNMYKISAAHKTLPLGTYVEVFNKTNGKELVVRINDRGPFVKGRIIDLSYAAAKELGVVGPGTAPVKIRALGTLQENPPPSTHLTFVPVNYNKGNFLVQIGAFKDLSNAKKLISSLSTEFTNAHYVSFKNGPDTFYRVRVGKCSTLPEAEKLEKKLYKKGFHSAFVVGE